jgi:hypothetical protein
LAITKLKSKTMKQVLVALTIGVFALTATSCNSSEDRQREADMAAQQRTLDSMKLEMARNQAIDSMNEVARIREEEEKAAKAAAVASASRRSSGSSRSSSSGSSSYNGAGYTQPVAASPAPVVVQEEEKKKGWSAKAKGAVIGAGVGAASGAIINKRNRGAGAIIGGVGGAAVGTGVGAIIDKKKGR